MRKIYLIVILSLSKLFVAQTYIPFPNDSAEWYNTTTCQVQYCNDGVTPQAPDHITQRGDTIINLKNYHKLYKASNNTLHSFYREASKRIYSKYPLGGKFGNDTAEFVLYDFNLNVGDTVYIKVPASWMVYVCPATLKRVIATISSTVLPSGNHKTFNFPFIAVPCCPMPAFKWIEGVGSNSGLLYNLNYFLWSICISYPAPYNITLTCNFRNGGLYYANSCAVTKINNSTIKNTDILIFPNPTNGNFIIKLNNEDENKRQIELTNLLGEILFRKEITNSETQININNFPTGLYFLKLINGKNTSIQKLIKD